MFDYTYNHGQKNSKYQCLIPHPDGAAWPKCCRGSDIDCAFIKNQSGGSRLTKLHPPSKVTYGGDGLIHDPKTVPFMCAHLSTDDGYYRVCAGWDACFGNKAEAAKAR